MMDTRTGEIRPLDNFMRTMTNGDIDKFIVPIDRENLSPRVNSMLNTNGKATIGRNHKCPCGSGKRFKRCCMFED